MCQSSNQTPQLLNKDLDSINEQIRFRSRLRLRSDHKRKAETCHVSYISFFLSLCSGRNICPEHIWTDLSIWTGDQTVKEARNQCEISSYSSDVVDCVMYTALKGSLGLSGKHTLFTPCPLTIRSQMRVQRKDEEIDSTVTGSKPGLQKQPIKVRQRVSHQNWQIGPERLFEMLPKKEKKPVTQVSVLTF